MCLNFCSYVSKKKKKRESTKNPGVNVRIFKLITSLYKFLFFFGC